MLNHVIATQRLPEPLELECSRTLNAVDIRYDTYGTLNADRSNAVLVLHALTGWSSPHEWWSDLIGEDALLDSRDLFIICPNFIGSCYGSTGPDSIDPATGVPYAQHFPQITVRDIARANLALLDTLGLDSFRLGVGGSMGGMVLLEMAALRPSLFEALLPIAVSGTHSAWRIAFSSSVRKTITAFDPTLADRARLAEGMRLARQIAMTSYRCAGEFEDRFGRLRNGHDRFNAASRFEVESYLEHQGDKIVGRFSPYSYLLLTRAMELYDLAEGRGSLRDAVRSITAPALFVGISSDILYAPHEIEEFALLFPNAEYTTLDAQHGHDSFLVDTAALAALVKSFVRKVTTLEEVVA